MASNGGNGAGERRGLRARRPQGHRRRHRDLLACRCRSSRRLDLDTLDLDSFLGRRRRREEAGGRGRRPRRQPRRGPVRRSGSSQDRQADLNKETIGGIDVDRRAAGQHARAERHQGLEPGRRAAGGARHGRRLRSAAAAARHRLQFRGARHEPRAEGRRRHGAGRARRGDGQRRHRGHDRAADAARARGQRRGPEPAQSTGTLALPGAAKGPPQSVGYKGSRRSTARRSRARSMRSSRAGRTSPPTSGPTCSISTRSAAARRRRGARAAPPAARRRRRPSGDRHRGRCAASTARSSSVPAR